MKKITSFYRFLVYVLPAMLFFSYWPVISLGTSESMNFEFSLPLIWLVIFDVVALYILAKKKLLKNIWQKWFWLLFPAFVSLSVLWSMNSLRGLLTVGILWLVYFAGYAFWGLKSLFSEFGFFEKFWKVFFASALVVCGWCFLQCILDMIGASREVSLMCAGCTYKMFGFPHPNGFAIEPQFMGNLLLAPVIVSAWFSINRDKKYLIMFFVFVATLFLTFSRGAIYAFIVAMIFMTLMLAVRTKKWRAMLIWPVILGAFLFTLNLQGMMSEFGPTNDTYKTGIAKVLNHLSLGIIDIRSNDDEGNSEETDALELEITENDMSDNKKSEAVFDGYVEESTDTRLRLSGVAVEVWRKNFATMMFGVGIGGAGQALYVNGLSPAPKEIVQNQYVSLLLETGILGIILLVFSLALVFRAIYKKPNSLMVFSLILAYMVSLMFFSGLPNVLHIYLLPALFLNFNFSKKSLTTSTKTISI